MQAKQQADLEAKTTAVKDVNDEITAVLRNVRIIGDTYAWRVELHRVGASWYKDQRVWRIAAVDKAALERHLNSAGVAWHYFRPHTRRSGLSLVCEYDSSRHQRLAQGCTCIENKTCDNCQYSCCGLAVPETPEQPEQQMWAGVRYHCPEHGLVTSGTDD